MICRLLRPQHIRSLYLNNLKRLKQSIYPTILMTFPEQQQQPHASSTVDIDEDLNVKAKQVPSLPVPPKWNGLFTATRAFSSTAPKEGKSTVQVIPADQVKRYSFRNRGTTPATTTTTTKTATVAATTAKVVETSVVKEASAVAAAMATTMTTYSRTTRSSQSTTQVIGIPGTPAPSPQYRPPRPPTLEEYIEKLPLIRLPANYTVITTKCKEEVDRELAAMISQESVFGLDLEWKPSFRKGVPQSPTGLMQICGATKILLVQVSQMQGLSEGLVQFLTNSTIYKTGVNIRGDGVKLYRDYNICTNGLLDLRPIAVDALEKLPVPTGSKSLRSLTGIFMGVKMPKGRARCSNWNAVQLSPIQVEYAANDAYASYALYHILMDATKLTMSALRPHHLSREGI